MEPDVIKNNETESDLPEENPQVQELDEGSLDSASGGVTDIGDDQFGGSGCGCGCGC